MTKEKPIKLAELASRIHAHLMRMEADPKINVDRGSGLPLYCASALAAGSVVKVAYVSYQHQSSLTRDAALAYLAALDDGSTQRHHHIPAVAKAQHAAEVKRRAPHEARHAASAECHARKARVSAARDAVIEAARVLAAATTDEGGTIEPGTMGPAELRAVGDAEEAIRAAVRALDEAEAAK